MIYCLGYCDGVADNKIKIGNVMYVKGLVLLMVLLKVIFVLVKKEN